ncbi:tripartite tricarboxylate transporter TctB family protein [Saccharothrix texasensis]|uniref:Putative tricarboxylic transport membrane protein n=1 Tax=Saccharothrix texasensis TaxID=103734 RepID=A0A3N1GY86_9PSEU|nr:tripartite tricarboxylate transporter TctB family protein [Saccharothrix texasensis]ROP35293.1 putative tricarboxylic transport membrane protein [Saccharothrix texasensis]
MTAPDPTAPDPTAPDPTAPGPASRDGVSAGVSRSARAEEYVFGALVAALGVFTLVDATSIAVRGSTGTVGPRAFPYAVGVLLLVTGVAAIVATARGRLGAAQDAEDVDAAVRTDWATVVKLVAVLVAHLALIDVAGWPVAAAVLFFGAAWTLGAVWWKALLVAVALALVVQVLFASGLGLSLPAGVFEGVPLLDG